MTWWQWWLLLGFLGFSWINFMAFSRDSSEDDFFTKMGEMFLGLILGPITIFLGLVVALVATDPKLCRFGLKFF